MTLGSRVIEARSRVNSVTLSSSWVASESAIWSASPKGAVVCGVVNCRSLVWSSARSSGVGASRDETYIEDWGGGCTSPGGGLLNTLVVSYSAIRSFVLAAFLSSPCGIWDLICSQRSWNDTCATNSGSANALPGGSWSWNVIWKLFSRVAVLGFLAWRNCIIRVLSAADALMLATRVSK